MAFGGVAEAARSRERQSMSTPRAGTLRPSEGPLAQRPKMAGERGVPKLNVLDFVAETAIGEDL